MSNASHETRAGASARSLAGRRVLVTGASRGIGRATATRLAAHGARVIVHARLGASALARDTGAVLGVDGDLRDRELPALLAEAASTLGGLDLLILNAAILGPIGPMESIDLDTFGEVMRVNVECQLAIFQGLLPTLLASTPSSVIWLSSGLGRFAVPGDGAYCASKHAIEGLSKLAHAEYGGSGLTSVTVAPGMVQTDMLRVALGTDDVSQHSHPDEIGEAFVRLAATLAPAHSGMALEISDF